MPIKLESVVSVVPHTEANSPMDIVTTSSGRINVANRDDPETPRYQYGDSVLVIPVDYVIPEWLLKHNDLWNEEKGKGYLKGSKGNRSCVRNIAGVASEVMLVQVTDAAFAEYDDGEGGVDQVQYCTIENVNGTGENMNLNDESMYWGLGVKQYINPENKGK